MSDPTGQFAGAAPTGLIARIGFADRFEEVWSALCEGMSAAGFDRVNYSFAPALRDPDRGSRSQGFAITSHPHPRMSEVYRSDLLDRSPMRMWALRNVGAISWSEQPRLLRAYGLEAEGPALDALLKALGFHAGWTIGFPFSGAGGKGAMGLTARPGTTQPEADAAWRANADGLMALASAAHGRLSQMPLPVPGAPLTAAQRTALAWIADGKTVQDVAVLMERSVSSIEKHLAAARQKLDVETTAQAVARLALLNRLTLPAA